MINKGCHRNTITYLLQFSWSERHWTWWISLVKTMCSSHLPKEHYFHNWTYQVQTLHLCVVSALYLIVIHRYVVFTVVSWLAGMYAYTRSKVDRYTITSLWLDRTLTTDRPLSDTFCHKRYLRILLLLVYLNFQAILESEDSYEDLESIISKVKKYS